MAITWNGYIFSIVACSLVFVIGVFILKLYYFYKMKEKWKSWEYASSISIFLFGCAISCLTILTSYNDQLFYMNESWMNKNIFYDILMYRGAWTLWSIACVFCYCSFMIRLNNVFKQSSFAISKKVNKLFLTLVILFFMLETSSTSVYICYFSNILSLEIYETIHLIIVIFQVILDGILTVLLIKLFINKLTTVLFTMSRETKIMSTIESHSYNQDSSNVSELSVSDVASFVDLTYTQVELLDVITKYNVLGIPAIISTQVFLLTDLLFIIIILITESKEFEIVADTRLLPTVWLIDCVTNVICLFLNTKNTQFWYYWMCGPCHKKCKQTREEKTKETIAIKTAEKVNIHLAAVSSQPLLQAM